MKRICTLLIALMMAGTMNAQTITRTASTASNLANPSGGRNWSIGATISDANPLNNGLSNTDYLFVRGFDFSSLPSNIVVTGLSVTFTRSAGTSVSDSAVRLVVAGAVYYAANTNAASTPTTWPSSATAGTYTFSVAALSLLNTADFQNANFGIAISARRTAGNISATVANNISVTLTYSTLAPLILTDFNVSKNNENQVEIRFSTATEDNVQNIFVERSTDGKNFEKLFTLTPRGARNVYTYYNLVDKNPAKGNNYYRITEVDKNGRWFYYITKLVTISERAEAFKAFYNGSGINVSLNIPAGQYEVLLADRSGRTMQRKQIEIRNSTVQTILDVPNRTDVYVVVLKGNGIHEARQLAITR